jgi:regulatory protein
MSDPLDQESRIPESQDVNPADIRFAAMNLLARREHTVKELIQKLSRRFPDTPLLQSEIQRLADENLQSDERFAENYVSYRSGLGFGLMHIRQDMRQRGLTDFEISLALERAEVDWKVIAEKVYHKKFGELPAADIKEKAKRVRFMQYRGFSNDEYQHLFVVA